jgi:hypothetical protein
MKNVLAALIFLCVVCTNVSAQTKPIRPEALGISFIMNDFTTPQHIRSGSLAAVLRDKQFSKFKEMSPGLAVTYFKGLKSYLDFAGTLAGSFVEYPLRNKSVQSNSEAFLLEVDGSVNLKLLDERYWMTPYVSAGLGASKFKGYYAAFIPLGLGFKVNLFDEAAIFFGSQYRVPVTETANYHFMYNVGISGVIGK